MHSRHRHPEGGTHISTEQTGAIVLARRCTNEATFVFGSTDLVKGRNPASVSTQA